MAESVLQEFLTAVRQPHTLTMYHGGVQVVIHCSKSRTECETCEFRIEALVSEECQRVPRKT